MTKEQAQELQLFDLVVYLPTNEDALVKRVTENGVFCIFRIQSTAQLVRFEDIETFDTMH